MKKKIAYVVGGLSVLAILVAGGVIWFQNAGQPSPEPPPPPSPSPSAPAPSPTPAIPPGWETHRSDAHSLVISYPTNVDLSLIGDRTILLTKWGPTQRENTEFYDGLSLSITTGTYQGNDFQAFVAAQREMYLDNPATEEAGPLFPVQIKENAGWQFEVTGLGSRTYLYFPWAENQYLQVTNGTADPTNQGFSETVRQILETVTMI